MQPGTPDQGGTAVVPIEGLVSPAMMHEKARLRIEMRIRNAPDPQAIDAWLDLYYDSAHRATEWDADRWGFDADRWMESERVKLAKRGGPDWPEEPMMRCAGHR